MRIINSLLIIIVLLTFFGIEKLKAQYDSLNVVWECEEMIPWEFTPDSKYIIGFRTPNVVIIDVETGETISEFYYANIGLYETIVDLSPDGNYIAAASDNTDTKVFNFHTGELINTFPPPQYTNCVKFNPSNNNLVINRGTALQFFDIHTGLETDYLRYYDIKQFDFSHDGKYIGVYQLWSLIPSFPLSTQLIVSDMATGEKILYRDFGERTSTGYIRFANNSYDIFFTDNSIDSLRCFDLSSGTEKCLIAFGSDEFEVSPDDRFLVQRYFGEGIKIMDMNYCRETYEYHDDKYDLACSPDSKYIASGNTLLHAQYIETGVPDIDFDINIFINDLLISPNPALSTVIINFYLLRNIFLEIYVSDINGNLIRTIHSGTLNEGNYNFLLNTNNISIGAYFISFTINGSIFSEKIIINK
ncbi:T9SS type A sorting domain-containing protein [Bacteroidota bacterium]